jgi:hypothetical protein
VVGAHLKPRGQRREQRHGHADPERHPQDRQPRRPLADDAPRKPRPAARASTSESVTRGRRTAEPTSSPSRNAPPAPAVRSAVRDRREGGPPPVPALRSASARVMPGTLGRRSRSAPGRPRPARSTSRSRTRRSRRSRRSGTRSAAPVGAAAEIAHRRAGAPRLRGAVAVHLAGRGGRIGGANGPAEFKKLPGPRTPWKIPQIR